MSILPVDTQRFIHLKVLAGLHAASAKNALVGIVAVEGIGNICFIRLGLVRDFLVLDMKKPGGVVNRAVSVAVVADRAIEQVVAENPVKRFALGRIRARRDGSAARSSRY